jgi:hypothetical protein
MQFLVRLHGKFVKSHILASPYLSVSLHVTTREQLIKCPLNSNLGRFNKTFLSIPVFVKFGQKLKIIFNEEHNFFSEYLSTVNRACSYFNKNLHGR